MLDLGLYLGEQNQSELNKCSSLNTLFGVSKRDPPAEEVKEKYTE